MKRIIIHWTAGTYLVSALDRQHYHFIVGGDGKVIPGVHKVEANASTADGDYAAHTRGCNMDSIGISVACMGNAVEGKSDGPWPMKEAQFNVMIAKVAELAKQYKIAVTPKTILTHAEVQPTLGIQQAGKWDISRIPFKPELKGHKACGDFIRERVSALI